MRLKIVKICSHSPTLLATGTIVRRAPRAVGIIGARLNSSRLPRKHLLDLAGRPLIARLFDRLERAGLDQLVLATTADAYNRPLVEWALAQGKSVFAYPGDVNDLMGRVGAVVREYGADIVAYFCGDSPLIEPDTVRRMVEALRADPAADAAGLEPPPGGRPYIHEGFMVWSRHRWERILAASSEPHHREHVGSAARELSGGRTLLVPEDPRLAALDHRISVDTPADYRFMEEVYRRWYADHPADSLVSLAWVVEQLQHDTPLRSINAHVRQKGLHDRSRRILLAAETGPRVGLGHLRRITVAAHALQEHLSTGVELLVAGPPVAHPALALLPHRWLDPDALPEALSATDAEAIVLDLPWRHWAGRLEPVLETLGRRRVPRVGIDAPPGWREHVDLRFLPSFHRPPEETGDAIYGWDSYLLPPLATPAGPHDGPALVLTGGSDPTGLAATLPARLDATLPAGTPLVWVQGPYAPAPILPVRPRLDWQVRCAPADLAALMSDARAALCVYGVSLFELLQRGVPAVTFSPYAEPAELAALANEEVCAVAPSLGAAATAFAALLAAPGSGRQRAARAATLLANGGGERLALAVRDLLERPA